MFWFDIPADVYRMYENMNESCDRAMRKKNSIEFITQYIYNVLGLNAACSEWEHGQNGAPQKSELRTNRNKYEVKFER